MQFRFYLEECVSLMLFYSFLILCKYNYNLFEKCMIKIIRNRLQKNIKYFYFEVNCFVNSKDPKYLSCNVLPVLLMKKVGKCAINGLLFGLCNFTYFQGFLL